MKKLCLALLLFGVVYSSAVAQTVINANIIPLYSVGTSVSATQMMTISRLTLTGLTPGRTYRYISALSANATLPLSTIPTGGMFMINDVAGSSSADIVGYVDKKSFGGSLITSGVWNTAVTGGYGEFKAIGTTYTGWFCAVNDGSASLGTQVYFYVKLNDGLDGTSIVQQYRTAETMITRDFSGGTNGGSAITSTSIASNEQIVALYDNTNGTGRPLSMTWTENNGISEQWTTWYTGAFVPATSAPGKWAGWIPNNSSLKSYSYFNGDGNVQFRMIDIDDNGFYNNFGIYTANANWGTTPQNIDGINQIEKISVVRNTDLQRNMKLNVNSPNGQIELYADLNVGSKSVELNSMPITDPSAGGFKIVTDNTSTLICGGSNAFVLPSYFSVVKDLYVSNQSAPKLSGPLTIENQLDLSGNGRLDIADHTLTLKGPPIAPLGAAGLTSSTGQGTLTFDGTSSGVYIPGQLSSIKTLNVYNPNGVYMNSAVTVKSALNFANNALINNKTFSLNIEGTISGSGGQDLSATEQVLVDNPAKATQYIQGTFAVLTCNSPVIMNGNLTSVRSLSINRPFNISNYTLTVKGSWVGDPAQVSGGPTSSLCMAGSVPQDVPTTANVYNIGSLIIDNPTVVNLYKEVSLARSLELLQGTLLDNGHVITLAGDIKGSAVVDGSAKVLMTGGTARCYISDATIHNLELNSSNNFELNGTFTGNTTITKQLNLINGVLYLKSKGLFFTGSLALPVIRTTGTINTEKNSTLGFGSKLIKHTGVAFTLPAALFQTTSTSPTRNNNALELGTFIMNRTNSITLNAQQFDIHKLFSLIDGNLILPGNYQLDIKSNSITETAMVDVNPNPTTAKVTYGTNSYFCVERFIPRDIDGGLGKRAYRDLAPGVVNTSGSIWHNWQEGAPATPLAGYGTHISGKKGAAGVNDPATGLDMTTTGESSGRTYWVNPATSLPAWVNMTNTKNIEFNGLLAYRILIRGDRTYNWWWNIQITNNVTKLRSKGQLIFGDVNFTASNASASSVGFTTPTARMNTGSVTGYTMIPNPYAAPISWNKLLSHNSTVTNTYCIYDPNINTIGGYVHYKDGVGTNNPDSDISDAIQSGQAFFVKNNNTTATSFSIIETDKVVSNTVFTNVFKMSGQQKESEKTDKIRISLNRTLYNTDKKLDAVLIAYASKFNDNIDFDDVNKFTNSENNLSVLRNAKEFSIETRNSIKPNDTIPLQITSVAADSLYKLQIDLSGVQLSEEQEVYLSDALKKQNILLVKNSKNDFAFIPTADASSYKNRFSVIFRTATVLPVSITSFTGFAHFKDVVLNWTTSEKDILTYSIERSADGKNFNAIGSVNAKGEGVNAYSYTDNNPLSDNYYRIIITSQNGAKTTTQIIRIGFSGNSEKAKFNIYPNPARNYTMITAEQIAVGETINADFFNAEGKLLLSVPLQIQNGVINQKVNVNGMASGKYTIRISSKCIKANIPLQIIK